MTQVRLQEVVPPVKLCPAQACLRVKAHAFHKVSNDRILEKFNDKENKREGFKGPGKTY